MHLSPLNFVMDCEYFIFKDDNQEWKILENRHYLHMAHSIIHHFVGITMF